MIIGVSRDGKLKLSTYLGKNYLFKYVDVDKILANIFKTIFL